MRDGDKFQHWACKWWSLYCQVSAESHSSSINTQQCYSCSFSILWDYGIITKAAALSILNIMLASWRRPPGRPLTTGMKNIHDDLSSLDLGIDEARDLVQNRPLCRLMSLHSTMHSQWCMLLLDWIGWYCGCCECLLLWDLHTHLFNDPLSGSARVSRYQKGKNQSGFYWSKRQWVAVASAGPYASLQLTPDR